MLEVIVGVALSALLSGLLVPFVKGVLDRRSERFSSSVALIDTLAISLWTYWKLALRVAYYGRQVSEGRRTSTLRCAVGMATIRGRSAARFRSR